MRHANLIAETAHSDRVDPVYPVDATDPVPAVGPDGDRHRSPLAPKWGQAWAASCLLLSLAITVWLGLQMTLGAWTGAYVGVGALAAFLLWIGLAVVLQLEGTPGVVLSSADAPALFEALVQLRNTLKGPRIDRVVLDTQFTLRLQREPRFGRFGGAMNRLTIGLPVLLVLDRRRLLALLAHEYVDFHGGRGPLARWFYKALRGLPRLRFSLVASPLQRRKMRRRAMQRQRLPARLLGRHAAAAALIEYAVKADWIRQEFWPGHWRAAATSMKPLPPFAALRARAAAAPPPDDFARESLRRALALPVDPEDSLSLLRDRLDALRASRQLPAWSTGQAFSLLGPWGQERLDEFDRQWCRDNAVEWKLHRTYLGRVRVRGQWLARRFRRSSADDLIEVAGLMRRLDVNAKVRELYERALHFTPAHAGALIGLLQCVPDSERQLRMACAVTLFDISDSHRCLASRAAVATLEKVLCEGESADGDHAELARWRARRDEAEELERRARQELASADCFDSISPGDLNEFDKGELVSRVARCLPVARAWLVRKQLTDLASQRCYLVFVELSGVGNEQGRGLCRELEQAVALPGLTRVVAAGRSPTLGAIISRAFEPVYVRVPD